MVLTNGAYVGRWIKRIYGTDNQVCSAGCHPAPLGNLEYTERWRGEITVNGSKLNKPYALLTNRHSPMKRFEYALWALKSAREEIPDLSLVITGQETKYTEELRYLVDGLRLNEKVHFVGLANGQELARLYEECAFYVYPSPEEDFGMGIVEAMAAGAPVVAWNSGGPTVTVRNRETGFLADPHDAVDFSSKFRLLATSPALGERMGRAGHLRAKEVFSYERHNEIIEKALLAAIERRTTYPAKRKYAAESFKDENWDRQSLPSAHAISRADTSEHYQEKDHEPVLRIRNK